MTVKVAINGFGRIGRDVLRIWALSENPGFEITHVTARRLSDTMKDRINLFKYDTIYRKFPGEIEVLDDGFKVNGKKVTFLESKKPEEMNWKELGVDVVIESSGAFRSKEQCQGHLDAGAKKVIITAPGKGVDHTFVIGVNDKEYDPKNHNIISSASCTTNCLAPLTKVILDNFGIKRGLMTTIHAYTNDQNIHDSVHKDPRRARAAAENIVPTTTGAAKAVSLVIPEVEGILTGMAVRVPVATGSLVDVTYEVEKEVTVEEINAALKKAADNELKGVLEYTEDPIVSSDIIQNEHSCIFDASLTLIKDKMVKCIAWYDNEWGYSERVIDLTSLVAQKL
ncbi:type I glyceraldehyde-3-phosphate dehydrogenase [Peptoniphilus catoniae]|uniref:type I glyceraldehyde-3-phosphate dehydrogenase n=1 Tax=Peptoniphilus catoniae TaxID=1660341 RepID=UPI0010FD4121|nr:type I glyceraldehyde-3-phosphate dehydrogenase [Peptoniphilus catoniae]